MALTKQAKILTDTQIKAALSVIKESRHPNRNRVIFLLSIKAGLRAKEIACVTWSMVTDSEGNIVENLSLQNVASKGKSGRVIPMHKLLIEALEDLREGKEVEPGETIILSERGDSKMLPGSIVHWFDRLYDSLGFSGCSSHSGRRTFITSAAKKASLVGASIRDVQQMAGHTSLYMTQAYIEGDSEAKRKLINLI